MALGEINQQARIEVDQSQDSPSCSIAALISLAERRAWSGKGVALEAIKNGPGAAGTRGGTRGLTRRHQPRDGLAAIGDDDLFPSLDRLDQLR